MPVPPSGRYAPSPAATLHPEGDGPIAGWWRLLVEPPRPWDAAGVLGAPCEAAFLPDTADVRAMLDGYTAGDCLREVMADYLDECGAWNEQAARLLRSPAVATQPGGSN